MKSSVRWILLFATVGIVAGVALWLGGDTPERVAATPIVASPGTDAATRMALPETTAVPDMDRSATPRELTAEAVPAPDPTVHGHAAATSGPRVTVIGRLVSARGRPIADAFVALTEGPAPRMQAMFNRSGGDDDRAHLGIGRDTTGADGAFRIEAPLPEPPEPQEIPAFLGEMLSTSPRLLVEHGDFVTSAHSLPELIEGVVDAGTLVLDEAGRVVGRVVATTGGAVGGARIAAQRATGGTANLDAMFGLISGDSDHASATSTSAEDGTFELGGLPPGLYDLAVRAKGHPRFLLEDVRVGVGRPHSVGDLALEEGTVLGGLLRDGSGDPVAGLKVRSMRQSPGGLGSIADFSLRVMLGETHRSAVTDEHGRFLISGVSDGKHDLQVGGDDTGWSRLEEDDVPGGTRDLDLMVYELGELLVTVRETPDGPRLVGAELEAVRVDDDEDLRVLSGVRLLHGKIPGHSDADGVPRGVFIVPGAGREGTELTVSAEGYASTKVRAPPVLDGSQLSQTVLLVPESVVEGVVLDDTGRPVPDAEVEARPQAARSDVRTVGGRVVTTTSTEDSSDGMLRMLGMDHQGSIEATTDETGQFRLTGLGAGDWELIATADDCVPSEPRTVTLSDSDSVRDLALVVTSGGTIVGKVTEAGDVPVQDARIQIAPARQELISFDEDGLKHSLERNLAASFGVGSAERRTVSTGTDGRFEARGLASGEYAVTLKKTSSSPIAMDFGTLLGTPPPDDGRTIYVTVVAREEVRADFVRSQRAAVTVRVTADGRPVENASVSLSDAASSLFGVDLSFGGNTEHTDAEGIARFDELEPATYKLSATVPGAMHREEARVELDAGRQKQIELTFGGATLIGRVLDEGGEAVAGVDVNLSREKPQQPEETGGFFSKLLGEGAVTVKMEVSDESGGRQTTQRSGMSFGDTGESITTDDNGDFQLKYLSSGAWLVSAGGGSWIPSEPISVDIDETRVPDRVTLHVRSGATVTGQVIEGSTEELLDGVRVELQQANGETVQRTRSDDGVYVLEGVPAGDYVLVIEGKHGDRARRQLQVGSGGPKITAHLVTLD